MRVSWHRHAAVPRAPTARGVKAPAASQPGHVARLRGAQGKRHRFPAGGITASPLFPPPCVLRKKHRNGFCSRASQDRLHLHAAFFPRGPTGNKFPPLFRLYSTVYGRTARLRSCGRVFRRASAVWEDGRAYALSWKWLSIRFSPRHPACQPRHQIYSQSHAFGDVLVLFRPLSLSRFVNQSYRWMQRPTTKVV